MKRWIAPIFLSAAVALAGCGGGGGGGGSTGAVTNTPSEPTVQAARLGPAQAVEGYFTSSAPRMAALDPESGDGSHCQLYRVTLEESGTLTVLMQSDAVDSYLQLFDESFLADPTDDTAFIAESDDVGTTLNSLISEDLPAGTYVVVASTAYANVADTGPYALMSMVTY